MNITETVYHTKSQFIESLSFDMVVDQASQIHLLNIHELVFRKDKSNTMTSEFRFRRKSLIRVRPDEDQSSDSLSDEGEFDESPRKTPLFSFFNKDTLAKKTHRDQNRYKISLERENKSSSPVFLNMIANTIDKQRRIQANAQLLKAKGLKSQPSLNKRMLFKMTTFKTLRGLNSDSRNIQSFRDLLYYVERTRPRNWIKDKPKDTNEPNFRNIFISTDRHQRHNTIDTDFSTPCTIRHRKTQSNLESNKPGEAFKLWLQHEEARLLAKHSKAQSPVSNLNDKP